MRPGRACQLPGPVHRAGVCLCPVVFSSTRPGPVVPPSSPPVASALPGGSRSRLPVSSLSVASCRVCPVLSRSSQACPEYVLSRSSHCLSRLRPGRVELKFLTSVLSTRSSLPVASDLAACRVCLSSRGRGLVVWPVASAACRVCPVQSSWSIESMPWRVKSICPPRVCLSLVQPQVESASPCRARVVTCWRLPCRVQVAQSGPGRGRVCLPCQVQVHPADPPCPSRSRLSLPVASALSGRGRVCPSPVCPVGSGSARLL